MAEEKYISKVRISGENYVIRDKDSYALAQTAKEAADAAQNTANSAQSAANTANSQIGSNDGEGLRKRVKEVEDSIKTLSDSTPAELANLKSYIDAINNELADPGATNTMLSILDTLKGFDKSANVKDYIDNHDQAILGTPTDEATAYTVYGVRKYVDTTAKENLIGSYSDSPDDNTIWGAKRYADEAFSTVTGELIGTSTDASTADTIWGAKNYAFELQSQSYHKAEIEANSVLGTPTDSATAYTVYGVRKYTDKKIETLSNTAFKVRRTEEGGEGILEFSTVSSYAG